MPGGGIPVWSHDGQRLALLGGDVAYVVNATTGLVIARLQATPGTRFDAGAWTSDDQQIVTSAWTYLSHFTSRETVQIWTANDGALLRTAFTFEGGISVSFSPDGVYLALYKRLDPSEPPQHIEL